MEFFRPYLKERHGARTQLAAALGVCYGSARKAKVRMSLTAQSCRRGLAKLQHPKADFALSHQDAIVCVSVCCKSTVRSVYA